MTVKLLPYDTAHPGDTSELSAKLATLQPDRIKHLTLLVKTEGNSDVAQVAWRAKGSPSWMQAPVMSFTRANAAAVWAGRTVPSKHNTSAPDMVFRDFSSAAQ